MTSRSSTQITQLKNPRLLLLFKAVGWLIVAMSAYVIFLNIPIFYNYVLENSKFPYASPEVIAWIRSIIRRFGELLFFIIAISILWRSNDPKALLIAICCAPVAAAIGGSYIEVLGQADSLGVAITLIVASIAATLGILLLFVLPNGEFFPNYSKYLMLPIAIVEALRTYLSTLSYGSLLSYALFIPLLLAAGLGLWAQLRRYRDGSSIYKQQFKWIIFGAAAVVFGISLTLSGYILLPQEVWILSAGLDEVGGVILAISMIFALSRYRLYDIDLFINRSLVYAGVFVGLAALFAGIVLIFQVLLPYIFPSVGNTPALLAATLFVAMLFDPTRRQIQHWIDRNLYHFRFDLNQLEQGSGQASIQKGNLSGQTIGGFHLLDVIGRGGMSEVYRGLKDGRMAAVKILADSKAHDESARKRFEREADLTARFNHTNIVHLYAHGKVDNMNYLALEYIEGLSLDEYIEQQERLSLSETIEILREIGSALSFAHAQGLIHRDIKPSNVMLRKLPDGRQQAVLMDLGLAKVIGESSTVTGLDAIGTIAYMSPEQIQEGKSVDSRSDIYSLGVMAYQMVTGELPFKGSAGKMLFGHINQPAPDPLNLVPDLPLPLALAIQIAMEKDPEDRFQELDVFLRAMGVLASAN